LEERMKGEKKQGLLKDERGTESLVDGNDRKWWSDSFYNCENPTAENRSRPLV